MGIVSIFPLSIGISRIKVIHKSYYWLLLYIGLDLFFQIITPFIYNIFLTNIIQNILHYTSTFSLLILLFKWGYLKNNKLAKCLLIIVFAILMTIELFTQNIGQLKTPWCHIIFSFVWLMAAVQFISDGLCNSNREKTNWSRILILSPLISTIIYYIILHILMAYLYNKETEQLFKNLYSVINFLQVASQFCFVLALFWAPKKEVYLENLDEHLSPKMENYLFKN